MATSIVSTDQTHAVPQDYASSFEKPNVPGEAKIAGVFCILDPFTEWATIYKNWTTAKKINHREGVVQTVLRAVGSFFAFSFAFVQIPFYALKGAVFFKLFSHPILPTLIYSSGPLATTFTALGLLVAIIAAVSESIGVIKTSQFKRNVCGGEYAELMKAIEKCNNVLSNKTSTYTENTRAIGKLKDIAKKSDLSNNLKVLSTEKSLTEFLNEKLVSSTSEKEIDLHPILLEAKEALLLFQLEKIKSNYFGASQKVKDDIKTFVEQRGFSGENATKEMQRREKAFCERRKNTLIYRAGSRITEKLENALPDLVGSTKALARRNLQNSAKIKDMKDTVRKAEEIMDDIKTQANRKLWVHRLGFYAAMFAIIGLIAAFVGGCPFALIIALAAATIVLGVARQVVYYGYLESEDRKFSAYACIKGMIPETVRNLPETIRDLDIRKLPQKIAEGFEEFKTLLTKDIDEDDIEDSDEDWVPVISGNKEHIRTVS